MRVALVAALMGGLSAVGCGKCDGSAEANDSMLCVPDGSSENGEAGEGSAGAPDSGATGGGGSSSGTSGSAGKGGGGAGGKGGSGGGGGTVSGGAGENGGGTETVVVAECHFDDEDGDGCRFEGWDIDNALGGRGGPVAVHPPELDAGDVVTTSFSCGGAAHSQLRFWMHPLDANAFNSAQMNLQLFVDDTLHRTFAGDGTGWREVVIDVPNDIHTYTFTVNAEVDSQNVFVFDDFVCTHTEPASEPNGRIGFDGGFIPVEVDLAQDALEETWHVDNLLGAREGEALHPPPLLAGDKATAIVNCNGDVHSQLRFWMHPMDANAYNRQQVNLQLFVDGTLYRTFAGDGTGWREVVIDLPNAPHEYTLVANAEVPTQNIFVLDSFVCSDTSPVAEENGRISFDQGFIPVEVDLEQAVVTETWHVDNLLGAREKEALHPPPLLAGDKATAIVNCKGDVHSQLRFWMHPMDANSYNPQQANLQLFVDGELYRTFAGDGTGWREVVIDLPNAAYEYTFIANAEVPTQNIFVLDSFVCTNEDPVPGVNSRVDFDLGFIPVELDRQDWFVDNLLGARAKEALHPPPLLIGETATTTFDCNGEAHTTLRFWLHPMDANAYNAEQAKLELFVDGELYRTFSGDGTGWREFIVEDLAMTAHEYTFTVSAEVDTQNVFVLDTFAWE